jgi:16S rRNA (adenine1518-N6/adenine1519-N6)-dimethyltransferase
MDLTSIKNLKLLAKEYQASPSKRFGQNFLINKEILNKVIESAEIQNSDTILEVGPGIGSLTLEIAKRAQRVIAVEKDIKMTEVLKETIKEFKNVEIERADILKFQPKADKFKIVSNLPFYLTGHFIRKFLESNLQPESMTLIIQKEVAQRIVAKPPKMSILAVSVQAYAKAEIISYVPKESFWPEPEVDAAIIKIVPHKKFNFDQKIFFRIVKAGFSHPRKQLINNLSAGLRIEKEKAGEWLKKNNIQPNQRAETLKIKDWIELLKTIPSID